jgi:hypothetical protein
MTTVSDVWDFKKDVDGWWRWQRQSLRHELVEKGRQAFRELEDCIADARRCGYAGSLTGSIGIPAERSAAARRRNRR